MKAREVLHKFKNVKRSSDGFTARCPAHDDDRNSLSISDGADGRLLLFCHAGCSYESIRDAVGLESNSTKRIEAAYDYRDEQGVLLYQVIRYEPKSFMQRKPDGKGGWDYKLNGVRRVPYRLSELLASDTINPVIIVEGEQDVDRAYREGLVATTNAGGAGKWRDEYNEALRGRHVIIIPDNDEPGRKHALQVARSLHSIAASIRILELPDLTPKGDLSDWLDTGWTLEQLKTLANAAPLWNETKTNEKDEPALLIKRMADIETELVRWLWHPYIALGKLTILEGDPGLGKSWLTCALAAAVSCGRGLPGAGPFEPSNVLMLSAEDGLADTLRPRLDAVSADVSRVFALAEPLTFDTPGLIRLEAAIIEHEPALVIIDPLFAFTGGKVDIHRANECRAISAPLAAIAERQGCALLAVRHLGKSRGGGHALNAGIGSIDLVAAARSVLLVGADPDEPNKRAIVQVKNNLAPHGEAIGYTLDDGQFHWTGASPLTATRILSVASDDVERGALVNAKEFLSSALADGAREVEEVAKEARQVGITMQTLRRAREQLGIRARRVGQPGTKQQFLWSLDGVHQGFDDVQKTENEHHRVNGGDKGTYSNNLPDDVHTLEFEHHREPIEHHRTEEIYIPPHVDLDELAERTAIIAESNGISDAEAQKMALEELTIAQNDYVTDAEGNRYNF
jgi:putative DNA primase/helicase